MVIKNRQRKINHLKFLFSFENLNINITIFLFNWLDRVHKVH
jgi:hypothetical protein